VRPRFDQVLLDTGAGISDVVLYTVSLADEVLVVATPEPTSLTDAYATIKVLATTQGRRRMRLLVNQAPHGRGPRGAPAAAAGGGPLRLPRLDARCGWTLLGEVPPTRPCARRCSAASCCWTPCPAPGGQWPWRALPRACWPDARQALP
jgi:flagellar biosynthesis protein FlhG